MGALTGYKVLDLSILVQGPQAAAMMHDLGAEVTKIELPEVGDLGRWLTVAVDDDVPPMSKRTTEVNVQSPSTFARLAERKPYYVWSKRQMY